MRTEVERGRQRPSTLFVELRRAQSTGDAVWASANCFNVHVGGGRTVPVPTPTATRVGPAACRDQR